MRTAWFTVVIFLAASCITAKAASPERPNIVFIMADDHGRQAISCYGSKVIQTPSIDRLAKEGIRFTQAFANNSICSPSRAVLLTGKYNHLCGVERLGGHFDGSQQTFPKLLQKAGYQTALVGKWHLFTEPTGFDYFNVAPGNGGRYYNPLLKEKGKVWGGGNSGGELHKGYMTDVITDVSLDWLKHRDLTKPFCLMIHHKAPHDPHDPAPRAKELFKDTVFPEPATLLDEYKGRAPEPVANQLAWSRLLQRPGHEYDHIRNQFTGDRSKDTRLVYQEYLRNYLRLVATLDENVGRVLDYLDASGLATNTIVIYTADNGFFLGEHGFYNKMWMYEEGFHIPLIVRMPHSRAAATNAEMVSILDIAPTILDCAGVKVPSDIQGRSMKPMFLRPSSKGRKSFYYHYYGLNLSEADNWIASTHGEICGVRTKGAKLVFYPHWKNGPFWELFDLEKDPLELTNLYADPGHHPQVVSMEKQLRDLANNYKDTNVVSLLDGVARSYSRQQK